MANIRKKKADAKAAFKNIALEIGLWLFIGAVALSAVILLISLFAKDERSTVTIVCAGVALAVCGTLAILILIYKNKNGKCRFTTYAALRDAVKTLSDETKTGIGTILLTYQNTNLMIEQSMLDDMCHCVYHMNGKKKSEDLSFDEAYDLTSAFLHEKCKEIAALMISDSDILRIENETITYLDAFDRTHTIALSDCVRNEENIGERDISTYSYTLYTPMLTTKIFFDAKHLRPSKKRFFSGEREERFFAFQREISFPFLDKN